jgi:hypothetical protein
MVAVYLVIGLLFLFSDIAIETFPFYRTALGIIFTIYADFRLFMSLKTQKRNTHED